MQPLHRRLSGGPSEGIPDVLDRGGVATPGSQADVGSQPPADTAGSGTLLLVRHVGPRQAPLVRQALASGREVACLSLDPEVAAALGHDVLVLPEGSLPAYEEAVNSGGALDLAESVAQVLLRRRPGIARRLAAMVGEDGVDRYVCRWFLRSVGDLLAVARLASSPALAPYERIEVDRYWPGGADLALVAEAAADAPLDLPSALAAALDRLVFRAVARPLALRTRTAGRTWLEVVRLWRDWLSRMRLRPTQPLVRPLLIRHYDEDWGIDRGGQRRLRNFDFVVDGETIRPDEVTILAEESVPSAHDAELADRGYAVLRRSAVTIGPVDFVVRVLPALVRASVLLARIAGAEGWWREPARALVSESLLWREVARRQRPRVLVAYNDLHPTGLARTLALRDVGCRTVAYEYSSSWAANSEGWIPDHAFAFTILDAVVTWGPRHSAHLRNHRALIDEVWEVGCLWSEHARLVRDDPEIGLRYRDALEQEYGVRVADADAVIGVFDDSVTPLLLDYDEMVAFYAGVAALASTMPAVLFVCKPKRPVETLFANSADGPRVEALLRAAPNVVLANELFETAAVVGLCDLSVNACHTSPAIETIGAGRPAVYYDPTDHFPGVFYRRFPGFVATSEDALAALVRPLLGVGEDARLADLRARFSELEGRFDGFAITRLREHVRAVLDS